jgi:hypothetical protein
MTTKNSMTRENSKILITAAGGIRSGRRDLYCTLD